MKLKDIHVQVEESEYKPWQVYFLVVSVLTTFGLYFEIRTVSSILQLMEGALSGWGWVVILGIQGVLIGFVAELLYDQGDEYAKSASHLFGSKDRTLFFRIGVMTMISGIITKIVPPLLENSTEYLVLQTAGAVVVLGILLIHQGISDWNVRTEWPAIAAGTALFRRLNSWV
ncbi:hypothetical protein [Natronobiforma cellulositropha]|uniref:hypothetical protein n=1 Tax=Natronobiforma cellulositropha TaxID=1679076 RepID=UPI0021D57070|nr:hypothetical protein [Natronobiforma cellulositropha]